MRKGLFPILSCLLLSLAFVEIPCRAQQENGDLVSFLDHLKKAQSAMSDFTADIKQVRTTPFSKEPLISRGKMRFKRPDKMWVEMYPPYPTITVLDKGVLLIYFPDERVAQRYQVAGNPALAKWLLFIKDPIETLGKKIWVREEKPGDIVLGVDPAEDLAIFREISIAIDTSLWMPKRIELVEKNGDHTTINYDNITINSGMPDSSFTLRLPPDCEIIEPMRR
jgi:outer membrane lipoprotein-sorting protein